MKGMESPGIPEMVVKSIMKCDIDWRWNLYSNVVIVGGTTLFTGFAERLRKEITDIVRLFIHTLFNFWLYDMMFLIH